MNDDIINEQKSIVKEIIEHTMNLLKKRINLTELQQSHLDNGESRSLELIIEGMEDIDTGYVLSDGKIRIFKKLSDEPTVRVKMKQDTFIDLCTGKKTLMAAFHYGELDIEGSHWLRDLSLWQIYLFEKDGGIFG